MLSKCSLDLLKLLLPSSLIWPCSCDNQSQSLKPFEKPLHNLQNNGNTVAAFVISTTEEAGRFVSFVLQVQLVLHTKTLESHNENHDSSTLKGVLYAETTRSFRKTKQNNNNSTQLQTRQPTKSKTMIYSRPPCTQIPFNALKGDFLLSG